MNKKGIVADMLQSITFNSLKTKRNIFFKTSKTLCPTDAKAEHNGIYKLRKLCPILIPMLKTIETHKLTKLSLTGTFSFSRLKLLLERAKTYGSV